LDKIRLGLGPERTGPEGGNILLALNFDLGFTLGAAFSVRRRIREAFWLCLGLVVVWREK
jgi:hypothetical protein